MSLRGADGAAAIPRRANASGLLRRGASRNDLKLRGEVLRSEVPVHDVPECCNEIGTLVAVVDVIRVLPHVERQHRASTFFYGRVGIFHRLDRERAVVALYEPSP